MACEVPGGLRTIMSNIAGEKCPSCGSEAHGYAPCSNPRVEELNRIIEQYQRENADLKSKLEQARAALRYIAFWLPVICHEHDDKRYTDVEDVFRMKRLAADATEAIDSARAQGEEKG